MLYKKRHLFCIDCNKKISYGSKLGRCNVCAGIEKSKRPNFKLKNGYNYWSGKKRDIKTIEKIRKSQYHSNISGQNNPFYGRKHSEETRRKMSIIHGGTGIPYEHTYDITIFNKELKYRIFKRDKFKCLHPECSQYGGRLTVHHIDYDKQNCQNYNLITLCRKHNSKVNYNRNYWKEYFYALPGHSYIQ